MNIEREHLKQARVLVVDDEQINVLVLQEMFDTYGYYNIKGVSDPVKAVNLYMQENYDVVLLDIKMPGLSGFEVMEQFAELRKDNPPPVLVLTALHDDETRLQALNGGASDFVTKPFKPEEVMCRVNNLLEMHCAKKSLFNLNKELEQRVQARTHDFIKSQEEALRSLGLAAEYRDMDTASHTIRVGWYSKILGERIGISSYELDILFQAAPMHDIGKVGIPDSILLKQGKLTSDEWQVMQSHCDIGARILQNHTSPLMVAAKEIAQCHHERWDGSGYPTRMKGSEIPINARIVIIADIFDALTIDRPYKKAWTLGKTIDYIKSESGCIFDPDLIKIFSEVVPDFVRIREQFCD